MNKKSKKSRISKDSILYDIIKNKTLYIMLLPVTTYFLIFCYWPMYGVQIAFKNFNAAKGIMGSPWVGFYHFQRFFRSYNFVTLITNTITLNLYNLVASFPAPIILALLLNEVANSKFKRVVQTVTYAPHFLSTVVVTGMLTTLLSPKTGIVNHLIATLGGERIYFMGEPAWFKHIYVWSGVWQHTGWSAIIYLAALTSVDQQQHEAAIIDGANKVQRIWYINIPAVLPTAIILLILNLGQIMNVGFEKVFLLQNDLNLKSSDVISTYVYRMGLLGAQYSFSTAVGLFNSVINFILIVVVNYISRKVSEVSLW